MLLKDKEGVIGMRTGNGKEIETTFLKIEHYSNHPEVIHAAELLCNEHKRGGKVGSTYIRAARKLIASVWVRKEDTFRFSTKTEYFSPSKRKQVWLTYPVLALFKTMVKLNWVKLFRNHISPYGAKKTGGAKAAIYTRTEAFKELLCSLKKDDICVDPYLPLVELRNDEGVLLDLPRRYLVSDSYRETVETLISHHALTTSAAIRWADGTAFSPGELRYTRCFKCDFAHGGRFYSSFVTRPKGERLSITINNEAVGSLDLSELHPSLLIRLGTGSWRKHRMLSGEDIYNVLGYEHLPREAHKVFINTIINASSDDSAARSIQTATMEFIQSSASYDVKTYRDAERRTGTRVFPHEPYESAQDYVAQFRLHNPEIVERSGGWWGTLQLLESQVMEEAVRRLTEQGIPCLPVHDEVVVPVSKKMLAIEAIKEAFQHRLGDLGASGIIKAKWTTTSAVERIEINLAARSEAPI